MERSVKWRENLSNALKRHGLTKTRIHRIWMGMKNRCFNKNESCYKNYGGRGISVCTRWLKFENFLEDMGIPEEKMTLERIDNNQDYRPENCKWATNREQCNNKRNNHLIKHAGICLTIAQWEVKNNMRRGVIGNRLWRGWSEKDAITIPVQKQNGKAPCPLRTSF